MGCKDDDNNNVDSCMVLCTQSKYDMSCFTRCNLLLDLSRTSVWHMDYENNVRPTLGTNKL